MCYYVNVRCTERKRLVLMENDSDDDTATGSITKINIKKYINAIPLILTGFAFLRHKRRL